MTDEFSEERVRYWFSMAKEKMPRIGGLYRMRSHLGVWFHKKKNKDEGRAHGALPWSRLCESGEILMLVERESELDFAIRMVEWEKRWGKERVERDAVFRFVVLWDEVVWDEEDCLLKMWDTVFESLDGHL